MAQAVFGKPNSYPCMTQKIDKFSISQSKKARQTPPPPHPRIDTGKIPITHVLEFGQLLSRATLERPIWGRTTIFVNFDMLNF